MDYHIGDPENQVSRISTRIVSGEAYDKDADLLKMTERSEPIRRHSLFDVLRFAD